MHPRAPGPGHPSLGEPTPRPRDLSPCAARPPGVLQELRVENLLLIEQAQLRLAPGLNVLTGETGAGKTVLAHALDLLLGGRARAGIVRSGAGEAYVEGVFDLPPQLRERLGERLSADAEELVLARRVSADGRTRAYLGGRSAGVGELREIGGGRRALLRAPARPPGRALCRGRRAARDRRGAARLLRPARAPQADARRRAAGDHRRTLQRRSCSAAACLRGSVRVDPPPGGADGAPARAIGRSRA